MLDVQIVVRIFIRVNVVVGITDVMYCAGLERFLPRASKLVLHLLKWEHHGLSCLQSSRTVRRLTEHLLSSKGGTCGPLAPLD